MNEQELKILEDLPQFPPRDREMGELHIGKNDPKDGGADHWWCSYGKIHLSGYYALPALLSELAKQCVKQGYVETKNPLIETT